MEPTDHLGAWPPRPPAPRRPIDAIQRWVEWFGVGRLAAVAVAVVAVVGGGTWLLRSPSPPTEAGLPFAGVGSSTPASELTPVPTASAVASSAPPSVVVHVAGAVRAPGVYTLDGGARVVAAIDAAGGTRAGADPGALNLAAPVVDGERIYVPRRGEQVAPAVSPTAAGPTGTAAPVIVDVNAATAAELDALPGIGPATAQAIIDHREANGPFASIDDLEAVRGIGPAKLDAIRDLVTV